LVTAVVTTTAPCEGCITRLRGVTWGHFPTVGSGDLFRASSATYRDSLRRFKTLRDEVIKGAE